MATYPIEPTGNDIIDLTNVFADNNTNKVVMTSAEILEGYNNSGESATPLTSTPDGNKYNYYWYQVHNTVTWLVGYAKALFDNKIETAGDTMSGTLDMATNKITSSYVPLADIDMANKLYVDTAVSGAMWLGEIKALSYTTIPTLPAGMEVVHADGAAISRTTYATYFAQIGITYGAGDGSTTFNVPDLRGKYITSWDDGSGLDAGRLFGTSQKRENSKFILEPDYANRSPRNIGQLYPATESGKVYWNFSNANATAIIEIEGVAYNVHYTTQGQTLGFFYDIKKGQSWKVYGAAGGGTAYFIPDVESSENSNSTQTNLAMYHVVRIK